MRIVVGVKPVVNDEATRLALAARDGGPTDVAAFIRATQHDVWRLAAALVDANAADDISQDTYLRAWRALPAFEGASTARTWLLAIARRACADHVRMIMRDRRTTARIELATSRVAAHDPVDEHAIDDLLSRLQDERRSAFVLTQVVGLSYAEAAVVENVPVGTIRSRVARARTDLIDAWNRAVKI